jgi:hypothetical protein
MESCTGIKGFICGHKFVPSHLKKINFNGRDYSTEVINELQLRCKRCGLIHISKKREDKK